MRTKKRNTLLVMTILATATGLAGFAAAQDLHPSRRPSPMGMARITVGDTYMRVIYSRPYKRDRDNIFGTKESEALVPFGEVWRTGANEASELSVTTDVMVGDKKLAAGTYSLFTVPGPETWTVHINSALGLSGTGVFADGKFTPVDIPATDVVVVSAKSTTLEEEVDQLTFVWKEAEGGADMCLQWITTEVCVPFRVAN
ncbi:MAG: DUF2911 domain-containing protein [Acidobacteriota bacterium]|nr:DUF2911 domain-containing protein [Acidobacteriota bacterium]